ncbi:hypothetical protein [Carboxylicivirga sp. N1Y90]|uniref:hypothetical protein n=1 Tax=Carboxylicivirga fragile TaxID=3417571 RepID=UPI003D34F26D|nr:hypothetical protein [Marinilabiliaceae bacterium N1Y90]
MTQMKKNIAYLLLAIYGIVFAHNIIPHHHHSDTMAIGSHAMYSEHTNVDHHSHDHDHHHDSKEEESHQTGALSFSNHQHPPVDHHACHFEVRPVVKDSNPLAAKYLTSNKIELPVPLEEPLTINYTYYPQKLLESYNFAVPLRAPPIFS